MHRKTQIFLKLKYQVLIDINDNVAYIANVRKEFITLNENVKEK